MIKWGQGAEIRRLSFAASLLFSASACFYTLSLDRPFPLKLSPEDYQPVALLPIKDALGYPASGWQIYSFLWEVLEQKGYELVKPDRVSEALQEMNLSALRLSSDPESQKKLGQRLKAKVLIIGAIQEYKVQKAFLGTQTYQAWERGRTEAAPYDYLSLPTYYGGSSQIRLIVRMFGAEKGALLWRREGTIQAPSDSAEPHARKLVERLLEDLPPMIPAAKD